MFALTSSLPSEARQWAPESWKGASLCLKLFSASVCLFYHFHSPIPPVRIFLRTDMQSEGSHILRDVLPNMMQEIDAMLKVILAFISIVCFFHRTFLQHDSWGEDRCWQQISLRRKCKTFIFLSFTCQPICVFHISGLTLLHKFQVDYGATADELEIHFNGCGPVNRVTILCDRFSGHPKGWVQSVHKPDFYYLSLFDPLTVLLFFLFFILLGSFAYIEFSDRDSVQSAIGLHETLFRGRVLKVRSFV